MGRIHDLIEAARDGRTLETQGLLEAGINPKKENHRALRAAYGHGKGHIVKILLLAYKDEELRLVNDERIGVSETELKPVVAAELRRRKAMAVAKLREAGEEIEP